ncbi:hypothetical protein AC579_6544 [Pseudocercospora musae]|uniref:F-box domain-containing protein n=1 Tax=Pseudocercospora musae TaxID=113226 RepID=A0A139ILW5_9PEZI|nr:hypothetical protein AC579_6544 [Pseudocercospora musae]
MNLHELPEELIQDILSRLDRPHLCSLNLASQWYYKVATPLLWRELELTDCRTYHPDLDSTDEHDDTPMLKKLLVLIEKPWIAREIQTLTHRCHLSPPGIFNELPHMPFCSQTLSTDWRTVELVKMAVKEMKKVTTVRIVLGHPWIVDAILRSFFDVDRKDAMPVRRLWLENCRISTGLVKWMRPDGHDLPKKLNFGGLESVRFRRLPLRPGTKVDGMLTRNQLVYSRGGVYHEFQDGLGGHYRTTCNTAYMEAQAGEKYLMWLETQRKMEELTRSGRDPGSASSPLDKHPLEELFELSHDFDERIFEALENMIDLPQELAFGNLSRSARAEMAYRGHLLDPDSSGQPSISALSSMETERVSSAQVANALLHNASTTLTSLNLDWVLTTPQTHCSKNLANWCSFYLDLFNCRFPHLRAFQFRNCVTPDNVMPPGLYLLDHANILESIPEMSLRQTDDDLVASLDLAGLTFMEAHQDLQCLAWPMDHFFSHRGVSADISERVDSVIENLGRTLTDLRIDTVFRNYGEPATEEDECHDHGARSRRRLFITNFAVRMRKVESIKMEGGMPRDERREIIRALHASPLQKIVMIGISCPLGNTWGQDGEEVRELIDEHERLDLEGEDKSTIYALGSRTPSRPSSNLPFEAQYGWTGMPPMLHTLASHHSSTIRELKFCGYKGSAIILSPTAITTPLFSPMKYLHKLESVIISFWLVTTFENSNRDADVIAYWTNSRNPASTALVRITDEEPEAWEKELRTKFAPDALAWRITTFLGPFLSEQAKQAEAGVHVRASFCVGDFGGIFDLDLWIGKGSLGRSDVCLGFVGPREEFEEDRRRSKMEGRRWF